MKLLFAFVCLVKIGGCFNFVINGKGARIEDYPFYVNLMADGLMGGGSILSRQWILTAAHVVYPEDGETDMADEAVVYVGTDKINGGERHEVDKVIWHPSFVASKYENDIALLRLKVPIQYSERAQRIHLPPKDGRYDDNDKAMIVGLGQTLTQNHANRLQLATVPTRDDAECKRMAEGGPHKFRRQSMICAGDLDEQRDSAEGDSGGPLFVRLNGTDFIIGIVSFGLLYEGNPKVTQPGYYTRVSSFVNWIEETVAKMARLQIEDDLRNASNHLRP